MTLRKKEEGIESFAQTERRGIVSLLLLKVDLELHVHQQNNFDMKQVNDSLISL